ncbi:hypothetical protein SAMN04487995_4408 [Dyadobacter koreensis]|uniref:Uncharacterized protein n=1 Tax=Dyadobacter koreensis TaxID=408657 RepID=A0A1H6YC76_9BACT|nr:hypothetical protein [Dyadobacter koreensis]SEJ38839.1 hypothetical protein SAMN04487995_4408 [Dyadobacter koreensis]
MEDSELVALWRSFDKRLHDSLILNRQNAAAITLIRIKSLLGSMAPMKIFIIAASLMWATFLSIVLYRTYSFASPFFWISIFIHVVTITVVIGIYIYQVVLIYQTDISEPLFKTQYRLARLKSSTLLIARLMFLHAPVWSTFSISERMFENPFWLMIQLSITTIFVILAIWFFVNINYENRSKKWFRYIFRGKEWDPVIQSMEMLKEIEEYQSDDRYR